MCWPLSPCRILIKHGHFKHAFWVSNNDGFTYFGKVIAEGVIQKMAPQSSYFDLFQNLLNLEVENFFLIFSKNSLRNAYKM